MKHFRGITVGGYKIAQGSVRKEGYVYPPTLLGDTKLKVYSSQTYYCPIRIIIMTYPCTILLEPDIKYTILAEDGTPIYVTFTLPYSDSARDSTRESTNYGDWAQYNTYTGYVVIVLNVMTIAALIVNTVYGGDTGEHAV